MKALVVGYGSAGQRHARLLQGLGCDTAVVSKRPLAHPQLFADLDGALSAWQPGYVVIAGRTAEHRPALQHLAEAGFDGSVLIEKPLFERHAPLPEHRFSHAAVAYNLRFHPLVRKLREALGAETAVNALFIVGQYLPDWRPGTDYRESYSTRLAEGGGVLRDLSHEIDLALWLLGPWQSLTGLGGHFSELAGDSDDNYSLLLSTAHCPSVSVHMNYLDRTPRREIEVNTRRHTFRVDFIAGTFAIDGAVAAHAAGAMEGTYLAEHQAMLDGNAADLCSLEEGLEVMAAIDAAERASRDSLWVKR
jgi:predicted dehydrogenase